MLSIEPSQLQSSVRGNLLPFGARPLESFEVGCGNGHEAAVLELCVAGDEFGLPRGDLGLGSSVAGADPEARS